MKVFCSEQQAVPIPHDYSIYRTYFIGELVTCKTILSRRYTVEAQSNT